MAVAAALWPAGDRLLRGRPTDDETVVVIGAGLAGLTAARALADRGVPVIVLEAQNNIGSRPPSPMFKASNVFPTNDSMVVI